MAEMDANWIDITLYRNLVQMSFGAFVIYPAGSKPHPHDYDFYTLLTSAYRNGVNALRHPHDMAPFDDPLRPPSLSGLIRWIHAHMTGGTFDLTAVLSLAAPFEEASQLVSRMIDAKYDAIDVQQGLSERKEQDFLDDVQCACDELTSMTLEDLARDVEKRQHLTNTLERVNVIKARALHKAREREQRRVAKRAQRRR